MGRLIIIFMFFCSSNCFAYENSKNTDNLIKIYKHEQFLDHPGYSTLETKLFRSEQSA